MAKGSEIWVCPQCGFRLDIAPLGLYAEVQCPRCFRTERVHTQLGNFRLDAVLGVGGMSVVYRAFDVVLHRALALKVLNDTFRDQPERIERFENESAMMARVRHDNVTSVYSAGRAYGQFYIAMELIEGKNLEYMVTAEQPMGVSQSLDIIRQVASGLQAAAAAGLLHRDMKPGNILITPEGRAKVIDFGLAMDSREDDTEEIIWATPYYVPPETLQRKPEDVRTDIYALGMTLRFLLTGVERFEVAADSLQALVQCKRKLVPLSKSSTDIPAAMAELVDHMTEFSPADRPADYAELLAEIDEVEQELFSHNEPAVKKRRRTIRSIVLASGLGVGALLGLVFAPDAPARKRSLIPLPPSAKQESRHSEFMASVLGMLESKKYEEAVNALLKAAEQESDPCLGAWYAQLARSILGSCYNNAFAAEKAHELLLRHLGNASRVLPAGERSFEVLRLMDSRRYPNMQDWASGKSEWNSITKESLEHGIQLMKTEDRKKTIHPVLKVLKWFVLSEKAAWLGLKDLSEYCLNQVKTISSLGEYEVLSEMLSTPSIHRRSSGSKSELARAVASMREHDFTTAMERFALLAKDDRCSEGIRTQAQVLYELCETSRLMLETLRRKAPERYRDNLSDAELLRLARGLSPASRPAAWSAHSQPGHPAEHAIDGSFDTRWCAINGDGGYSFVLDIDTPEEISNIILHWEQSQPLRVRALAYADGKTYTYEFDRDKMSSSLNIGGKVLDRLELVFPNGGGQGNWAGVVEVQLVTKGGRTLTPDPQTGKNDFADELRAVLLMISGQYKEAFAQIDFIISRQGEQSAFSIMAADWRRRWSSISAETPSLPVASSAPSSKDERLQEPLKLIRRILPHCREAWLAEKMGLAYKEDGSRAYSQGEEAYGNSFYVESNGNARDIGSSLKDAYITRNALRRWNDDKEALIAEFPNITRRLALQTAKKHLQSMPQPLRDAWLAEMAGLCYVDGGSGSAYYPAPREVKLENGNSYSLIMGNINQASFVDSKGEKQTMKGCNDKYDAKTKWGQRCQALYVCLKYIDRQEIFKAFPAEMAALRKNYAQATGKSVAAQIEPQ